MLTHMRMFLHNSYLPAKDGFFDDWDPWISSDQKLRLCLHWAHCGICENGQSTRKTSQVTV